MKPKVYLDIETKAVDPNLQGQDAFRPGNHIPTVVGILRDDGGPFQIVCSQHTQEEISEILTEFDETCTIVGYNIYKFDIPILYLRYGFNPRVMDVRDIMFDCWSQNLKGGLKKVCAQLGIKRPNQTVGDGQTAMLLWRMYEEKNNQDALQQLLLYNLDDLLVLKELDDWLFPALSLTPDIR